MKKKLLIINVGWETPTNNNNLTHIQKKARALSWAAPHHQFRSLKFEQQKLIRFFAKNKNEIFIFVGESGNGNSQDVRLKKRFLLQPFLQLCPIIEERVIKKTSSWYRLDHFAQIHAPSFHYFFGGHIPTIKQFSRSYRCRLNSFVVEPQIPE